MSRDSENQAESKRIIGRVGAETEASMVRRVQDHMAGKDADERDWAELWGTRIGRWLGLVLLAYLLFVLVRFVVEGG
ncbi:hypothetical protein [Mesorhizobium sp. CAU 1741]|uniref:hypothetical protein n=1 Tax=Mesorhizobium sp. CAU 1741 TaxID=3140366 RepID=UPI00325A578D